MKLDVFGKFKGFDLGFEDFCLLGVYNIRGIARAAFQPSNRLQLPDVLLNVSVVGQNSTII